MSKAEPVGWWCSKCRTAGICSSTNPMNTHMEDHIAIYTSTQVRAAWEEFAEWILKVGHKFDSPAQAQVTIDEARRKAGEW